jgi:hypothetical protein
MKGIKTEGVPTGAKCAKNAVKFFVTLNKINLSHNGRAIDKVIARCLVAVNVNGIRPSVLLIKIAVNSEIKIMVLIFLFLRSVANSLFIEEKIL